MLLLKIQYKISTTFSIRQTTNTSSYIMSRYINSKDINVICKQGDMQKQIPFLKLEQAGIYWCEMGNTVGSVHHLHIDSRTEDPHSNITQAASIQMLDYKLRIYTIWTSWSPCSMCDAVGIKFRYGYCTISLSEASENGYFINESTY